MTTAPELVEGSYHFDKLSDQLIANFQFSVFNFHLNFGVIPKNTSKLIPGIGRDNTERYSSLKRLLTAPLIEMSAHLYDMVFSNAILLIKYSGSLPVSVTSLDDIVYRSE